MKDVLFDFPLEPSQIMELGIDDAAHYIKHNGADEFKSRFASGNGNAVIVAKWNATKPQTPKERDEFYRTTIEYIYDLVPYNAWADTLRRYEIIINMCANYIVQNGGEVMVPNGKKVLDFGGGIGTLSLILKWAGSDVSYFDLRGVISDFAQHRFTKHGVGIDVYLDDINVIDKTLDVIVAFDVLEHLKNPVGVVLQLEKLLNPGGKFFIFAPFNAVVSHPMHLQENGEKYSDLNNFDAELGKHGIVKTSDYIYEREGEI